MRIDPQHLLPAHVPFYKRKLFWAVVLFLVFITVPAYIKLIYNFDGYEIFLTANIFFLMLLLTSPLQTPYAIYGSILIIYSTLIYLIFFQKKVNFYALGILITLILLSFYATISFINSPFT
jgi:multidrug transporter EmrE-like cation transporter